MATFLDITIIEQFSAVFAFIFVFAVLYMILQGTKLFGDNKGLHSIISFCFGIFVIFTPAARNIIVGMSPWFVLLFVIILFILIGVKMLGATDADIRGVVTSSQYKYIIYFVITFSVIIVLFALSQSFGQDIGPFLDSDSSNSDSDNVTLSGARPSNVGTSTNTGDFNQNLAATVFHPKVLGMIFLLVVASFTMRLLAHKQ